MALYFEECIFDNMALYFEWRTNNNALSLRMFFLAILPTVLLMFIFLNS